MLPQSKGEGGCFTARPRVVSNPGARFAPPAQRVSTNGTNRRRSSKRRGPPRSRQRPRWAASKRDGVCLSRFANPAPRRSEWTSWWGWGVRGLPGSRSGRAECRWLPILGSRRAIVIARRWGFKNCVGRRSGGAARWLSGHLRSRSSLPCAVRIAPRSITCTRPLRLSAGRPCTRRRRRRVRSHPAPT